MNKFQAAFEILFLLSYADGEVDTSEIQIICNFLNGNYESISFDIKTITDAIDMLTPQGMYEELCTAVNVFGNYSTAVERSNLLKFAIELVVADGYVSSSEKDLLHAISNTWNIDLNRFLGRHY